MSDVNLAEDLTSAVFEKALTRLDSYRSNKASFSTWLLSIARNAVIDHYRVWSGKIIISIEETFELASEETSPEEEATRKLKKSPCEMNFWPRISYILVK